MSLDKIRPSHAQVHFPSLLARLKPAERNASTDILATMSFAPEANDIVIPVMGITGSGKSTFINTLVPEADLVVGDDIDSCTKEVHATIVAHPNDPAHRVVFIDTPGLDSTNSPDETILRRIADWLLILVSQLQQG